MNKHIKHFLYGIVIGAAMFIPGVSGGTTALLLGIYDELIDASSNLFKDLRKNVFFLAPIAVGGILGIALIASLIALIIDRFEVPMMFFFLGIVIGGIPVLFRKAQIKKVNIKDGIILLLGCVIILSLQFFPENLFVFDESFNISSMMLLLIAGIIIAIAFTLPGLSTAHMLLVLGLYQKTASAINEFDFKFLLILSLYVILGFVLTIKLLDYLLKKYNKAMYLLIIGFIIGSFYEIYPGINANKIGETIISFLMLFVGFSAITYITKKGQPL